MKIIYKKQKQFIGLGIFVVILSFTLLNPHVLAQEVSLENQSDSDRISYEPSYFSRYVPNTAADMVDQIPGFTLSVNQGNQSRGLGQGEGNLLINGKRPNSKDSNAEELLERIPADKVSRIDILTNGSIELAGRSGQIVDVILLDSNTTSGSWSAGIHELEGGITKPRFEASMDRKFGSYNITAGFGVYDNEFPQYGPEKLYSADNVLLEVRDENGNYQEEGTNLNFALGWDNDSGSAANLSFTGKSYDSTFYELSDRYTPDINQSFGEFTDSVNYRSGEDEKRYELGVDFTAQLNTGNIKVIGLRRYEKSDIDSLYQELPAFDTVYQFGSDSITIETEHILRTIYTVESKEEHSLEVALELVENNLDTASAFEEDAGNGFLDVFLDGSDVEVNEERAELSFQYSMPVLNDWSLQALTAIEYSEISVNGLDIENDSDTFTRYKGFLALGGSLSENTRLRSRLERSVGQLSFSDFASSRNDNDGTLSGGNTELVPPQTWRFELSLEYDFTEQNKLTATAYTELVDDFITVIPFGDGTEGSGNIDGFKRHGLDLNASFALDSLGVGGGRLNLIGNFMRTEFADPVTGEKIEYRQNRNHPVNYQIHFRQDVIDSNFAWGASLIERSANIRYRIDQVFTYDHSFPQAHILFIEHKDIFGLKVNLEVEDFAGFTHQNSREFYDGDRNGALLTYEENERHSPWIARLYISGSF